VAALDHPIAQNSLPVWDRLNMEASTFLDHYLKGSPATPLDASAQVTTCDATTGLVYRAADWASLAPYRVSFASDDPRVTSAAQLDPLGAPTDPITVAATHGGHGVCVVLPPGTPALTSHWDFPVTQPFTLLGEPAVHLNAVVAGTDAEIDTRLWDLGSDGSAKLVTRGVYRFNGTPGSATIDATLQGNGWDFQPGHSVRLEVTQTDAPYLRPDNAAAPAIDYASVTLTLPTPTAPAA
jgi:hypothetical protein